MKKLLFLLIITAAFFACRNHFKTDATDYPVAVNARQLEQGEKMTVSICAPCHYDPSTGKLTGLQMHNLPKIAGRVYSRNITQDVEHGIAAYTSGELAYLIRTGIARNGRLMPYMQRPNLADSDLQAIIVFLRSNDPLVTPSAQEPPETRYSWFGTFGINHFPGPLAYPNHIIKRPDVNDKITYGRYLVDNLSCYHCHSASFFTVNELEPERSKRYMGGGNKLKDSKQKTVLSANITFDPSGIGNWTVADFETALKKGLDKEGHTLSELMPRYTKLSHHDVSAIYIYLQSIPKINNTVRRALN